MGRKEPHVRNCHTSVSLLQETKSCTAPIHTGELPIGLHRRKTLSQKIEALFQDLGSIINMVSGIDKAAQQDTAQPHSVLSWKGRKSCFSDLFDQLLT